VLPICRNDARSASLVSNIFGGPRLPGSANEQRPIPTARPSKSCYVRQAEKSKQSGRQLQHGRFLYKNYNSFSSLVRVTLRPFCPALLDQRHF
jgi:hypothetical protein